MQNLPFQLRRKERATARQNVDQLIWESRQKLCSYLMLANAGGVGLSVGFVGVQISATSEVSPILALIVTLYALGGWMSLNERSGELSSVIFFRNSEFSERPALDTAWIPRWLASFGRDSGALFLRGRNLAFNISLGLFASASSLALGWIWSIALS